MRVTSFSNVQMRSFWRVYLHNEGDCNYTHKTPEKEKNMTISLFDCILLTLLNTIACLTLPRLLTLHKSQFFSKISNSQALEGQVTQEKVAQ